jgi:hypothetical protein
MSSSLHVRLEFFHGSLTTGTLHLCCKYLMYQARGRERELELEPQPQHSLTNSSLPLRKFTKSDRASVN